MIINDIHIGVTRKAGTTPASQFELKEYVFSRLASLLENCDDPHLIVNGDLFDQFEVEGSDLVRTFETLSDWLHVDSSRRLTLVCGNHDWSPKAGRLSSFHLLTHFLCTRFHGNRVERVDFRHGLTKVDDRVWAIPHMPNQGLFNLELERSKEAHGDFLLLHANYDNNFATDSDHSLNVSEAQAKALVDRGWTLIFGHEHQYREALDGKVVIVGNQIPTSVADCLGPNTKYALRLVDGVELVPVCDVRSVFEIVDWRNLDDVPDKRFIRVSGSATAQEAAEVVSTIAKLRQSHSALVITNAVKVEGMADFEALSEMTMENITTFNVFDALLEELCEREQIAVKDLLG